MIKNIVKIGLIITCMVIGFNACEYATIDPFESELPDSVSFSNDIIPIFDASCNMSGCHNTGGISPDLTVENAFTNLVLFNAVDTTIAPVETDFVKKLSGSMSKYILPNELDLIILWIEQNAPNN